MAEENRGWGYDRIAGALANLGYEVCDQTVGNVLQRHGLPPAPERKRTTCVCRKPHPFDLVTESLNVGRNGRADIALIEPGCLTLQVQEPT